MIHYHFTSLASTNDWAKAHINEFQKETITLITASEQTAGRGQYSRHWYSPPDENLYATFVFFMKESHIDHLILTQSLAKAVVSVLADEKIEAMIKWPNDIMIRSKKAAGILCETVALHDPTELTGIVIGIGLNVNMPMERLAKIGQPATSLMVETGRPYEIKEITALLAAKAEIEFTKIDH